MTQQYTSPRYIGVADTAKLVRSALKEAFPGIKFSVTSKSYAGGASIDVRWVDGPTTKTVDHVVGKFEGKGLVDSTDYAPYIDGELNGEKVHFGSNYVHTSRRLTPAFLTKVAQAYCTRYNHEMPEINIERDGSGYISTFSKMYDVIMPLAYMVDAKDIDTIAVGIERGRIVAKRAEVIALIEKMDAVDFALYQLERKQARV